MAMWLTKAVNLPPVKITIPKDDPVFTGVVPMVNTPALELGETYRLSITIDLSNPKYMPSEEFIEQLIFEPCLFTKNGSQLLLDDRGITVETERSEKLINVSVDFVLELEEMFKGNEVYENLVKQLNFEKLGITILSFWDAEEVSQNLIYQIDYFSIKKSDDSRVEDEYTFEPGVIVGEHLPYTIQDIKPELAAHIKETSLTKGAILPINEDFSVTELSSENSGDEGSENGMSSSYSLEPNPLYDEDSPYTTMKIGYLAPPEPKESVNHPSHYNDSEIETFEMFILMNASRPEKIIGALEFNIFKYRDRAKLKGNQPQDVEKMLWYLEKLELLFPEEAHLYNIYHIAKQD